MKADSPYEMYHFIGKDILYFHSLFWPAMLEGAGLRRPTKLFIHGYVTVNGSKMSKSRGTFIKADTFLRHFPAETLRYYYAAKMNNKIEEWFEQGLQMWDITRDSPYFGFKIPGTDDKFFYVWLDAPVG